MPYREYSMYGRQGAGGKVQAEGVLETGALLVHPMYVHSGV